MSVALLLLAALALLLFLATAAVRASRIPLAYNLRNLAVRRITTAMTVLGIGLTVGTFVALMSLTESLAHTLSRTASLDNAIIIRKGSMVEVASSVTFEQVAALSVAPQIARGDRGQALVSPEVVVQVLLAKLTGGVTNVAVRGVRPAAYQVHDRVHLVSGRWPAPGHEEVAMGVPATRRFAHVGLGGAVTIGRREWPVVGLFEAGGSTFESEVWTDADALMADARRNYYSSVTLKLAGVAQAPALADLVENDPRIGLQYKREEDYYAEMNQTAITLRDLGMMISLVMAIGAVFSAMNTMYAAISARTKEIGTLRALGFSRGAIQTCFVIESLLISIPGGILGTLLALPIVQGTTTGVGNLQMFTDMVFQIQVSGSILMGAAAFALLIGLLGGLLPAHSAASIPIIRAIREV